jgi:hypothetical protein
VPATKAYSSFFAASTSVAAGTTKASPVTGSTVDARTAYGGELTWRITNGGALGAACTIMFQTSDDGTDWYDYFAVSSSDLVSGTVTQGPSVTMGRGGMYLRAIAYGNTTNACTVEAGIQMVTAL